LQAKGLLSISANQKIDSKMADVKGTASIISGLLGLSIELTKATAEYCSDVHQANHKIRKYLQELSVTNTVLSMVQEALSNDQASQILSARNISSIEESQIKAISEDLNTAKNQTLQHIQILHRFQTLFNAVLPAYPL
jgi:hypothetical protein